MKSDTGRRIKAAALYAVLLFVDLFTKTWAARALSDGRHVPIIKGVLEFYYIENRGAAFGIFQNGTAILSAISLIAVIALIIAYLRIPDGPKYLPLRLIAVFLCAGAAGNLIDRITLHYVRDFIYFSLIDFPVFNVADIYVTVSVFFLILLILFYYKDEDLQFGEQKGQ